MVSWDGKIYNDRALAFGMASSAGVFGSIADMLVVYRVAGFGPIKKWVDDFFAIRLPDHAWTEEDFIAFTAKLGVPWSIAKLRRFSTVQRYISFDWNLESKSVTFPPEKIFKLYQLLDTWSVNGGRFSYTDAAKLHGKLVHASSIFPLIRPFIRSAAIFTSKFTSRRAKLNPTPVLRADIRWIRDILAISPVEQPLAHSGPCDIDWWGDASTSFGIGIIIGNYWAAWSWVPSVKVGPNCSYDIGWAEAVAVELGLRLGLQVGIIQSPTNRRNSFLVRSDNSGVVSVTNKGRSRSELTNTVLKEIFHLQAQHNVHLVAEHVRLEANIVDSLSRGDLEFVTGGNKSKVFLTLPLHLSHLLIPL